MRCLPVLCIALFLASLLYVVPEAAADPYQSLDPREQAVVDQILASTVKGGNSNFCNYAAAQSLQANATYFAVFGNRLAAQAGSFGLLRVGTGSDIFSISSLDGTVSSIASGVTVTLERYTPLSGSTIGRFIVQFKVAADDTYQWHCSGTASWAQSSPANGPTFSEFSPALQATCATNSFTQCLAPIYPAGNSPNNIIYGYFFYDPCPCPQVYTATITVKACSIGNLTIQTGLTGTTSSCKDDLGVVSGITATMQAPANALTYGTNITPANGVVQFSWTIPSGQSGIIAEFNLSATGYNNETYYFPVSGNFTKTIYIDRALGYTFYTFNVHFCSTGGTTTCANDVGPLGNVNFTTSGIITSSGTSDNAGVVPIAVNSQGLFTLNLSKQGFISLGNTFQNPSTTYTFTLYLRLAQLNCQPNPGSFVVAAAANFTCTNTVPTEAIYFTIFKRATSGLPIVVQKTTLLYTSGLNYTITYPQRGYTSGAAGDDNRGSYALIFSDTANNVRYTDTFIINDGSSSFTQMNLDSITLGYIQEQLVPQTASATAAASSSQSTTDYIQAATQFAFNNAIFIPNMYWILIAMLLGALFIGGRNRQ